MDYFRKKSVVIATSLLILTAVLSAACDTGTQPTATPIGAAPTELSNVPTPIPTTGASSAPSAEVTMEATIETTGTVTMTTVPNQ